MNTFLFYILYTYYLLYYIYLLPYYLSINQYFTKVVTYYFKRFSLLPYYFLPQNTPVQHVFVSFLPQFFAKIEKNMIIFCNFFSLCINDLRKS